MSIVSLEGDWDVACVSLALPVMCTVCFGAGCVVLWCAPCRYEDYTPGCMFWKLALIMCCPPCYVRVCCSLLAVMPGGPGDLCF